MKTELKIYTSYVSPLTLDLFTGNGLLPIFIIRNIGRNKLISKYAGTPIHMPILAPSNELFRGWRDRQVTNDEYMRGYALEMAQVDMESVLRDIEALADISGARGVVFLGYGSDKTMCHRSILSEILNSSGILINPIREIIT